MILTVRGPFCANQIADSNFHFSPALLILAGMKRLILWTNLVALAACARAIPPAPHGIAAVSAIPGVPLVDLPSPRPDAAADATVNDLADAAPDSRVVPAF